MQALLVTLGSDGDLYPFIGIGAALRARGWRVAVISSNPNEKAVVQAGLDYVRVVPDAAAIPSLTLRDLANLGGWRELGDRAVMRPLLRWVFPRWRKLARSSSVLPLLRPVYEAVAARFTPGSTVVAAHPLALGARVAHDALGVPLASVLTYPAYLRSVHRPPVWPPLVLPTWLPLNGRRAAYHLADALVFDRLLQGPLNAFRARLGLPPVYRPWAEWRFSPQRIIGLFPDWFAAPQPDWPPQTARPGFVRYEQNGDEPLSGDLEQYLRDGPAPVVFTAGTARRKAGRFFAESAEACRLLGRRGLLVTRFAELVPPRLPPGVRHVAYAPFGRLLPRAAAAVYHAGVGSVAQVLAAGIPHLAVPHRHDQHDCAARLQELGVSRTLAPGRYTAGRVAGLMSELLNSEETADRCRQLAARFAGPDPLDETCRLIEQLLAETGRTAA